MRVAWTVVATAIYWALTITRPGVAALLVPVYCFAVVLPYGLKLCHDRWAHYRDGDGDDGPGSGAHSR
jgi:hypothetical protein